MKSEEEIREKCKFYKKQFLSKYCELFKQPCYGKHCNFIKEFTRLNELSQQLQAAKEENEKLTQQNKQMSNRMIDIGAELINEQQQNKQMRVALEKISKKKEINGCTCFYEAEDGFSDCENCDVNMGCTYYIAKQALGE